MHETSGPIDLHVDSIIQQRLFGYDVRRAHRPGFRGQPLFWHADIPRMQEARFGGACMGIHFWPWESERGWKEMNRQIDYLDRIATEEPGCMRVWSPEDWGKAHDQGLLGLAPGVEGAHMLNGRVERVELMAARGVAYLTLAHFSKNAAATPSMGRGANETSGLTAFGRELVQALNQFGIAVDVAHVNTPGVLDVCEISSAPVFCTHTGVKGVNNVSRNISDAEIDAIAATGGVIGIMYAPNFLASKLRVDTGVVLDHLEYIVKRVGIERVALGSDYDGWLPAIPNDHRDCRDTVRVTEGLRQRGFTAEEIALVLRGNVTRTFQAIWDARIGSTENPS